MNKIKSCERLKIRRCDHPENNAPTHFEFDITDRSLDVDRKKCTLTS